jgi:hypothetical protein
VSSVGSNQTTFGIIPPKNQKKNQFLPSGLRILPSDAALLPDLTPKLGGIKIHLEGYCLQLGAIKPHLGG